MTRRLLDAPTGGRLKTLYSVAPPWKARCYAFRAFRPSGFVAFGGPLLGASDRQVGESVVATCCPPAPGVRRLPGALVSGHQLNHHWVVLRAARASARTRSSRGSRGPGPGHRQRLRPASASRRRHPEIRRSCRRHRDESDHRAVGRFYLVSGRLQRPKTSPKHPWPALGINCRPMAPSPRAPASKQL
jgi:hypothetical protein